MATKTKKPETALRARPTAVNGEVQIDFGRMKPDEENPEWVSEKTYSLRIDQALELAEEIPNAVGEARTQIHQTSDEFI